jgi:hypothetical protein
MRKVLLAAVVSFFAAACGLPFGIGQASTSTLLNGAADNLAKASSFEMTGTFTESSNAYKLDLQYQSSGPAVYMDITQGTTHVELLQVGGKVYYKGQDAAASYAGSDALGKAEPKAIGTNWFTTKSATPVDMSGITDANKVKANFLTASTYNRKDNVQVNGADTAELSDSDTIVNITESSPYQLLRVRTQPGKDVSGMTNGDLTIKNYNKNFGLATPTTSFDLDDPSTFPPFYAVTAVDLSRCNGDPCTVAATLQNMAGTKGAPAPSTVTFTSTNDADKSVLGTCKATITSDVANGQKTTVSCVIAGGAWATFVANGGNWHTAAVPDNPAYD